VYAAREVVDLGTWRVDVQMNTTRMGARRTKRAADGRRVAKVTVRADVITVRSDRR
jgi:hypothetical protein